MESAKVTNCNHLFHAVCLRKWLYVQNTCPLCHEVLYREDALESSTENEGNVVNPLPRAQPAPVPPPQQQRQTEHQNPVAENPHNSSSSRVASRRGSRQTSYDNRGNPSSDDNDTEPESGGFRFTTNNGGFTRAGPGSAARVEAVSYSVFSSSGSADSSSSGGSSSGGGTGARSRFFDMNSTSDSENGNSSGSEYTVEDGSDGDELWANEYSSSDDDEEHRNNASSGGRRRNRGNAIGLPLLL